jgi:CubicO group peptidase (beta-lactamase class C family)
MVKQSPCLPVISILVVLLLLLLGYLPSAAGAHPPSSPAPAQSPSSEDLAAQIDAYVKPFVETNNLSGVVFVSRGEQMLFQKAYGLANPAYEVRNTSQTRFHIASISKSFTAAAVLLLEERGRLSVSDPVSKFLPDYPNGDKIRLEHLLTHSAGLPNMTSFPELGPGPYVPYTPATLVAAFKDKPLDFEPGARFRYSNSNYVLLALIIEKVSGEPFGDFLKANVFDPLGLASTLHDGDATRVIPNLAAGTEPDGLREVKYVPYVAWSTKTGSGSLVSTTADLCAFAHGLFGGKLLQPASLAKITQAKGVFPYGWSDRERFGRAAKGVGGRSPGFISSLDYFPDDGTCVAILTNSYSSVGQVIAPDITAIVLGHAATPPPIAYARPRPGQLAEFTGRFQMPENYYAPNATLTLRDRGGYLEAHWSNGATTIIYPAGGADFVDRTNWAMVRFTRDPDGKIAGFTYSLLQDFAARKLPAE